MKTSEWDWHEATPYNERRLPRMHTGCVPYLLTGLVLVGAILAVTAMIGGEIVGRLAGIG